MRVRQLLALIALGFVPLLGTGSCAGTECERNSDCAFAQCISGECVAQCKLDLDCPIGLVCNREVGRCDPPDGGTIEGGADSGIGGSSGDASLGGFGGFGGTTGGTGGATGGGAGTGASSGTGGTPGTGGIPGTGGTGGAGTKNVLDLCNNPSECTQGLVCKPFGGPSRCTPTCLTVGASALCPTGTRCEDIAGSKHCVPSDIGKTCSTGSNCNFACLTAPKYCTGNCTTAADCPNGWGCMPVSNNRVCVKAAAACDGVNNSACVVPAACDLSPNLVVGSCTLACSTASDCPQRALGMSPWTCDGLCRRPSTGPTAIYGPLEGGSAPSQWACNGLNQVVNVCGDGQHIDFNAFTIPGPPAVNCSATVTTDGLPGDACVDSCRYAGGCPFGFQCNALGSIGANSRIGLCLPGFGAGKVGGACTRDADCFFGYCNRTKGKCSRDCSKDGLCPTGSSCVPGGGPSVEGLAFRRCE